MKVLQIDVNCKSSSTGEIVYNIHSYLTMHSVNSSICYGRGPAIDEKGIFKFGIDAETYMHSLLARVTGFNGIFSFFSTRRLIKYINAFKPDVIHIHELHAYFVNIYQLLKYIAKLDIPVIHTLHCEFSYTGKCGYSDICEKWVNQCGNCQRLRVYPSSLFFDHTCWMQNQKKEAFSKINNLTITTPSKWLSNRAKKSFFGNRIIKTVYNGVDTKVFHNTPMPKLRSSLGIKPNDTFVLSVAPHIMSERKGGNEILKIAELLKGSNVHFVLIGHDGAKVERGNVTILPPVYDKEILAGYYSEADLFLLCSSKETFSMTCAEALCCGTPIVGYKCGAPEEIFEAPFAEFFEYGDSLSVAEEINSRTYSQLTKEKTSEYGLRTFSSSSMAERYLELYESMV